MPRGNCLSIRPHHCRPTRSHSLIHEKWLRIVPFATAPRKSFLKTIMMAQAVQSAMNVVETPIPGVLVLEPKVFGDDRGFFFESYSKKTMSEAGIVEEFVQDNHSFSA